MFKQDYLIKGKHADYMRFLVSTSEGVSLGKSAKIFDYGYQVLFIAPLIGVVYSLKTKEDKIKTTDFTVKAIQMIKNNNMFEKVYEMVLLADRSISLTADERVDFVFRSKDDEKEKAKELFHSYMLGGIEWLYDHIAKNGSTEDDYINNMISAIQRFTNEFAIYKDIEGKIQETEEAYF